MVELILFGMYAGRPVHVYVPAGWSGKCIVEMGVRDGRPNGDVRIVHDEKRHPMDKVVG